MDRKLIVVETSNIWEIVSFGTFSPTFVSPTRLVEPSGVSYGRCNICSAGNDSNRGGKETRRWSRIYPLQRSFAARMGDQITLSIRPWEDFGDDSMEHSILIMSPLLPHPLAHATGSWNSYNSHHIRLFWDTNTGDACTHPSAMHILTLIHLYSRPGSVRSSRIILLCVYLFTDKIYIYFLCT